MARTGRRECSTPAGSLGHRGGKWVIKLTVSTGIICQIASGLLLGQIFLLAYFCFTVGQRKYGINNHLKIYLSKSNYIGHLNWPGSKKSCIRETLNLATSADSNSNKKKPRNVLFSGGQRYFFWWFVNIWFFSTI